MNVNNENFKEVLETVVIGNIQFQNYNPDCFGMSDLRLAYVGSYWISKLVEIVVESGNNVYMLVQPIFEELGYDCNYHYRPADFEHITEVKPFSVDLPALDQIYPMCEHIKSTVTNRARFLAANKYR